MDAWIRVTTRGGVVKLPYSALFIRHFGAQDWLSAIYEIPATFECMCNPERPVPMHLRRLRIRPPSYTVVTNPSFHDAHAPGCPRYKRVHSGDSERRSQHTSTGVDPPRTHSRERPNTGPVRDNAVPAVALSDIHPVRPRSKSTVATPIQRGTFVPSLDQLNDAQREAAMHKDGPCIVVAGAGSGKTAMLIARIKWLIDSGVDPHKIVASTFTRKATDEMKSRLIEAVGEKGKQVTIGTMHSIAHRMVMPQLGEGWTVIPEPSWLIERVLEDPGKYNPHGVGPLMKASDATTAVYTAKADGKWPEQCSGNLAKIYAAYEAEKAERKQMDFEDLLLHAIRLFATNEDFAKRWRRRWSYVLVDEFQDTNFAQWQFLLELVKDSRNLFTVGDDFQSIYYFRGARPSLMNQFVRTFPDAKKVFLTKNYRSHDLIVDLGNRVIRLNRGHQIEKKCVAGRSMSDDAVAQVVVVDNETEEAKLVADEMQKLHERFPDTPWREYAILYRTNIQSRAYEEALAEHDIPYQVVGDVHFYENRDVKTILDYLRTTQDTSDTTLWVPLMNRPLRYISQHVIKEVERGGWDAVVKHPKCRSFVDTIEQLRKRHNPAQAIQWLVNTYPSIVRSQDDDEPIKWVDSLITSASKHKTVPEFLRFVEWVIEKSKTPTKDSVTLSTIHRSKGLEYETVFVVGLAEGLLPHKKSVAGEPLREETRLCYVAITRAKENLFLLAAKNYGGKPRDLSRFIRALQNEN